jgi:hypothetical protein
MAPALCRQESDRAASGRPGCDPAHGVLARHALRQKIADEIEVLLAVTVLAQHQDRPECQPSPQQLVQVCKACAYQRLTIKAWARACVRLLGRHAPHEGRRSGFHSADAGCGGKLGREKASGADMYVTVICTP